MRGEMNPTTRMGDHRLTLRWIGGTRSEVDLADFVQSLSRTVAYYANGTRTVPRTVLLACKGWERELEEQRTAAA